MIIYVMDEVLMIETDEKLNSGNAEAVQEVIEGQLAQYPDLPVCVDAEKLRMISSMGLRVLMSIVHKGRETSVINVSPEVYDIFEATGFTTLMEIRKKRRCIDVTGCTLLGEGAFGSVYRLDQDTVVKVYRGSEEMLPMIEREKEKARNAFVSGAPTAIPFDIVRITGGPGEYGTVFEMIDAKNCSDIVRDDPSALDWIIPQYAEFLYALHQLKAEPGQVMDNREYYQSLLDQLSLPDQKTKQRLHDLLERMPEESGFVHGDIQLKNVMLADGKMVLVDMDTLSCGNPVFEFAGLYATYIAFNEDDPYDTEHFLGINKENAERIARQTLEEYLKLRGGEQQFEEVFRKVRIVGYLRFLKIRILEQASVQSDLKDLQIAHALQHLEELAFSTDDLTI